MELAKLKQYIVDTYHNNKFVNLLQMKVAAVAHGRAELTMPIVFDIHSNLYGLAHGGALASLIDTAMGVACATVGKRVVTLEINMNYLRGAQVDQTVRAVATIIHDGSRTLVVESELYDQADVLLVKARGTFFVIGRFEGV